MKGEYGQVRMKNNDIFKIIGMGGVLLETNIGGKLLLKNVRHVPDVHLNLISTGCLDEEGYCSTFSEGRWKLTRGSLIKVRGKKLNTLYRTEVRICRGEVNALEDSSIEL